MKRDEHGDRPHETFKCDELSFLNVKMYVLFASKHVYRS